MNIEYPRKPYQFMKTALRECWIKNSLKMFLGYFLFKQLLKVVLSIPMVAMVMQNIDFSDANALEKILLDGIGFQNFTKAPSPLVLVLLFLSCVLVFVFSFGMVNFSCSAIETMKPKVGGLFSGFKNGKVWVISVLGGLFVGILLGLVFWLFNENFGKLFGAFNEYYSIKFNPDVLKLEMDAFAEYVEMNSLSTILKIGQAAVFVVLILGLVWFPFVWVVLRIEKKTNPFIILAKSVAIMAKNFFHFIGFLFVSGGRSLIYFVAASVAASFIPDSGFMKFLGIILYGLRILFEYNAVSRMLMADPVYYYSLTDLIVANTASNDEDQTSGNDLQDSSEEEVKN